MIRITRATPDLLPEIAAIEQETFTDAWSEAALSESMEQPHAIFLVAEEPRGQVVGYAIAYCALDEAEVINVAVRREHRRRGYGDALLKKLIAECEARGAASIFLEVRQSNEGAIRLYEGLGFKETGTRKNYYSHPVEDALLMARFPKNDAAGGKEC